MNIGTVIEKDNKVNDNSPTAAAFVRSRLDKRNKEEVNLVYGDEYS